MTKLMTFIFIKTVSSLSSISSPHHRVLQLRIAAYDSAYPDHRAIGNVYITAIRNPSGPVFDQDPYRVTVTDTHTIGRITPTCF